MYLQIHICIIINMMCPVLGGGLRPSTISEMVLAPGTTRGKSPTLFPHHVVAICCGRSQALFPHRRLCVNIHINLRIYLLRQVSGLSVFTKK